MRLGLLLCLLALTGCGARNADLPRGEAAYAVMPPETPGAQAGEYTIGPRDQLSLTVYQEPELSMEEVYVDTGGFIQVPLIGRVSADGRTAAQLSDDIAARLRERMLVDPQVAVNVTKSNSRTVTVDGQVRKPGVYEIPGSMTLIQAIAFAEGTAEYARPSETIVMRVRENKRYAARFDLNDIRAGRAPDPILQPRDVVVVGYSNAARIFGLAVASLPGAAGLFVALNQ